MAQLRVLDRHPCDADDLSEGEVQFRGAGNLAPKLERRAEAEGITVSKLARRALEEYLEAS